MSTRTTKNRFKDAQLSATSLAFQSVNWVNNLDDGISHNVAAQSIYTREDYQDKIAFSLIDCLFRLRILYAFHNKLLPPFHTTKRTQPTVMWNHGKVFFKDADNLIKEHPICLKSIFA